MNKTINDIQSTFLKGSIFTKLIIINVAASVVYWILTIAFPSIREIFTVPGTFVELLYQPWTVVTYMFLHEGFMHLLFNMLWLFWFGQIFLRFLHDKQLLAVYVMGGLSGALLHLGINELLPDAQQVGIIGSSAAVMAVVFAISLYKPEYKINLLFIGPVKIKYVAYVALGLDIINAMQNMNSQSVSGDGVAHIAHLGGAVYGIWFAFQLKKGRDITRWFNNLLEDVVTWFKNISQKDAKNKKDKKYDRFQKPKSDWKYNKDKADTQKEVDRILDKISQSGYDSLTKKEKDFLFKFKKD